MKVLFLDVDGVLNSADWFHKLDPKVKGAIHELDPKAVKRVQHVLEVTGAVIVLSSTWRKIPNLTAAIGLPIYDVTPVHDSGHRGTEIRMWLNAHPDIETFAIIDDDADAGDGHNALIPGPPLKSRFVRTHWKHGMYGRHEKKLIELLGEK
jgi:HAD domain in Swiss Army Knife RNA repair proteins